MELLADEFIEFGSSGRVYTRDDLVAVLQTESPVVQTTSGLRMVTLAPDVALLTYKIRRHSDPCRGYLQSSLWRRSNGKWQMAFHQATVSPVT